MERPGTVRAKRGAAVVRGGPAPLERDIQRNILDYLALVGIFRIRVNQGGVPLHNGTGRFRPGPTRGVSDIHAITPGGRAVWIEVKRKGEKPTEHQVKFMDSVNRAGGCAFVASSVEEVRRELAARGVAIRGVA